MIVDLHVIVLDHYDVVAFAGKQSALEYQRNEARKRGLAADRPHEDVFHYSVQFEPTDLSSTVVYVVNNGAYAVRAFDDADLAVHFAQQLAARIDSATPQTKITITSVPLEWSGQSNFEKRIFWKRWYDVKKFPQHATRLPEGLV
jgi:hypothetical protein